MSDVVHESVYPVTPSVVHWLNHTLFPIEKGAFNYWRRLLPLVRVCDETLHCEDKVEQRTKRMIAESAIRQHNDCNGTSLTYEEIIGRQDYSMSDLGDWAAYCRLEDQERILFGDYDEAIEAFRDADVAVQWIVLWMTNDASIVVFRSPHVDRRCELDEEEQVCDGLERGDLASFVLPPNIEGSIRQDLGDY